MKANSAITIYTDGSCLGNPGRGGYAAVLMSGTRRKEISQGFRHTTNNRMELMAVIEALKAVNKNKRYDITIYTDSRLIVDAINKFWLKSWIQKGWKKSNKQPVLNSDLWKQLAEEISHHNVKFQWVEAHVGIKENERCDELGKLAAQSDDLLNDDAYLLGSDT
ncbi:MAG: ribonuclease HI [Candidatus Kapabacteria bacterium]|nr:ribonuclease HI [Ignavibacteriota bacterium]MCW5885099.1 ribonuclease HI [Candidatus Kapabacteria bacterium]